jgi:hypothetical protein
MIINQAWHSRNWLCTGIWSFLNIDCKLTETWLQRNRKCLKSDCKETELREILESDWRVTGEWLESDCKRVWKVTISDYKWLKSNRKWQK